MANAPFTSQLGTVVLSITLVTGCCLNKSTTCSFNDPDAGASGVCLPSLTQLQIDEPTRQCETFPDSLSPNDIDPNAEVHYWDVTLEQAIELALKNSEVLRDLGGTVLRSPTSITTVKDPAIAFTDPIFGEEAALSYFDATLSARGNWEKNDRVFNNEFIGDRGFLQQDLGNYSVELNKRSATGTIMSVRQGNDYDYNNSLANRFGNPSGSWTSIVEAEVRQPLLQGAGILFNRTAGPSDQPGVVNGVLVARIRTDVSLADFEVGLRNLVSNVENTYWDLYFSYRDLDAKTKARDRALEAWQDVQNKQFNSALGGEADKEGQAREQYWRFESEVIDSLNGRLVEATRNENGSGGGTFRSVPGVRVAERRLRLAIGLPITDISLIRPAEEPPEAPIQFDWNTVVNQSFELRPELRKQRWRIKQRELELAANRNFLLPRLDAVGRYRMRGFGEKLMSSGDAQFNDSLGDLGTGNFQEWQLGVEFAVPLGFRRAHAAVRNSELMIARERAVLGEQKRTVMYGLSNAVADVRRAYEVVSAQYNRYTAAQAQVGAIQNSYQEGRAPLDLLLEAQRRLVDAETRFHQARVDYALALKNVQFEKGTLLEYYSVRMAEGSSTRAAYVDAAKRERLKSGTIDYVCRDKTITSGPAKRGILEYPSVASADAGQAYNLEQTFDDIIEKPPLEPAADGVEPSTDAGVPADSSQPKSGEPTIDESPVPQIVPQSDAGARREPSQQAGVVLDRLSGNQVPGNLSLPYAVPASSEPSAAKSPSDRSEQREKPGILDESRSWLSPKRGLNDRAITELSNLSGTLVSPQVDSEWIPPRRSIPIAAMPEIRPAGVASPVENGTVIAAAPRLFGSESNLTTASATNVNSPQDGKFSKPPASPKTIPSRESVPTQTAADRTLDFDSTGTSTSTWAVFGGN